MLHAPCDDSAFSCRVIAWCLAFSRRCVVLLSHWSSVSRRVGDVFDVVAVSRGCISSARFVRTVHIGLPLSTLTLAQYSCVVASRTRVAFARVCSPLQACGVASAVLTCGVVSEPTSRRRVLRRLRRCALVRCDVSLMIVLTRHVGRAPHVIASVALR